MHVLETKFLFLHCNVLHLIITLETVLVRTGQNMPSIQNLKLKEKAFRISNSKWLSVLRLLPVMPASRVRVPLCMLVVLPSQLAADALGRQQVMAKHSSLPSTRWGGSQVELQAPSFGLAQPWQLQLFQEWARGRKISGCLCHFIFQINQFFKRKKLQMLISHSWCMSNGGRMGGIYIQQSPSESLCHLKTHPRTRWFGKTECHTSAREVFT